MGVSLVGASGCGFGWLVVVRSGPDAQPEVAIGVHGCSDHDRVNTK
jgi:hypothetical protein